MTTTRTGPVPARPQYVGGSVKRREDPRLLLGRGRFVADVQPAGTVFMAIVRSPHAHARIVGIDTSRALAAPGVLSVLTWADIEGEAGTIPCIDLYPDSLPLLQTALADGIVRYVGQPVVALVATSEYGAEDALELIDVEYAPLPAVVDLDEAVTGPTLLYPEHGTNVVTTIAQDVGEVDRAFAEADHVYEETFTIHRYGPVPMETRGVVAEVDPITERLTLTTSTQFPHLVRGFLSGVLGLPESRIRVIAPDVGGGFGAKCEFYCEEILAPLFALRLRRPVKWVEDRREHLMASSHAREQKHTVRVAVRADGTVTAVDAQSWTSNGAACCTLATTPASISSAMLRGPYRIPAYRARAHCVVTNKTPLAVYRGAGHPQAVLVMERMMDTIAADLGRDRVELRLQNMITPEELPSDRGTAIVLAGPVVYDTGDYGATLRRAAEMIGLGPGWGVEQEAARDAGRYLGIGVASLVEETAIGPYESAVVRVDGAGKVTVLTGSSPHGQGHVTTFSQLVADELEIDLDDITVLHGDTDVVADGVGTFASRSAAIGGAAARRAAGEVKDKALTLAAHLLEVDRADLEWRDGAAVVRGTSRSVALGRIAVAATAWNAPLPGGMDWNLEATYQHQAAGIAFSHATHAAKVEVDVATGQVEVVDYVVVHDCGTVINPTIVEGQVHGGVVQGIGGTFFEEFAYDANGQPLTPTLQDYLLPTVGDVPWIRTDHTESPTPLNPYGMKGAGEGGATGAPGALVNALQDALVPFGVTLTSDGPWTPEKVLALIPEEQG
ncbi:MAG: xanthine dehydrogenase family protein molybdopterin-binding subunit [Pseudonocardia sp.]|nr:xanthine dehydrogenase family protein molybdopterin-binding subunit [Pseudonocardia sp.]